MTAKNEGLMLQHESDLIEFKKKVVYEYSRKK
jgi:hypothetical protein